MNLYFTEKAIQKLQFFKKNEENLDSVFRIFVKGGGCSGLEYKFMFDSIKDGDHQIALENLKVVVDPFSSPYIEEATVDYFESFAESGFKVQNPNAKSTCGCGQSFGV